MKLSSTWPKADFVVAFAYVSLYPSNLQTIFAALSFQPSSLKKFAIRKYPLGYHWTHQIGWSKYRTFPDLLFDPPSKIRGTSSEISILHYTIMGWRLLFTLHFTYSQQYMRRGKQLFILPGQITPAPSLASQSSVVRWGQSSRVSSVPTHFTLSMMKSSLQFPCCEFFVALANEVLSPSIRHTTSASLLSQLLSL